MKNYYTPDISVEEAIPVVLHAISEVIEIDPNCGGSVRVALVKPNDGIKMLTNSEIDEIYNKTEPSIDTVEKVLIPKILRGEVDAEKIGKAIEKGTD